MPVEKRRLLCVQETLEVGEILLIRSATAGLRGVRTSIVSRLWREPDAERLQLPRPAKHPGLSGSAALSNQESVGVMPIAVSTIKKARPHNEGAPC